MLIRYLLGLSVGTRASMDKGYPRSKSSCYVKYLIVFRASWLLFLLLLLCPMSRRMLLRSDGFGNREHLEYTTPPQNFVVIVSSPDA
ncbi:uncharacterized protein ASPGLDRAFT_743041 [Aspergillus glaucus CBS 516.65]|uniref:Uncharacterized protein n=1 Tax=Aspergillus glaucus CBS 516.65 TaxID=1160497 RepID=A0A1L9VXX8_ASPGL|nr:hypothetical protein ASPGLDRAFT_743041 [Aspergillus glaucus CBS 516.65]OJJ88778.1 hypothetical protein ASPGLDRAFT_743041 [Aspergillus glaucus CBS 516.65]